MNVIAYVANMLLATAMWFIVGRLVLRIFIRDQGNTVWQMFLIITEPAYRVSRALTGGRVPERWMWLVSLVWLFVARVVVWRLYVPPVP